MTRKPSKYNVRSKRAPKTRRHREASATAREVGMTAVRSEWTLERMVVAGAATDWCEG